MKYEYDVIIIGSGIGGLACSATLAKNGYKVKIFEKLHQPGGYLNTFKRGDYYFEGSTHQIGGFTNPDYLKSTLDNLGINIDFNELDDSYEAILFDNMKNITNRYFINSGKDKAASSLLKYFPDEKKSIDTFINICENISRDSLKFRKASRENIKINFQELKYLNKYLNKSLDDLFNINNINNINLKFLLSQYTYYFMLTSPKTTSSVVYSNFVNELMLRKPLFFKNGSKSLINSCIDIINKNNGSIQYKANVKNILIKNNECYGIKLDNNEKYYADYIVSNVNAFTTFNDFIDKVDNNELNIEKIKKYNPSKSAFQIYLGLPFDLREYGYDASTIFFSNTNIIEDIYNDSKDNPENNSFLMTNYTIMNEKYSPKGKSSIVITEYMNNFNNWIRYDKERYKVEKEKYQNLILNKIQDITKIPVNKAEICFSATPKTMYYYSGKINGSIYGLDKSIKGIQKFDIKTNINNLFIVGADANSTGGQSGTWDSGVIGAFNIIKEKEY